MDNNHSQADSSILFFQHFLRCKNLPEIKLITIHRSFYHIHVIFSIFRSKAVTTIAVYAVAICIFNAVNINKAGNEEDIIFQKRNLFIFSRKLNSHFSILCKRKSIFEKKTEKDGKIMIEE